MLVKHAPYPVTREMMERQANVGPLGPSFGDDAPICIKAECKLRRQRHNFREVALLCEITDREAQKRFVGCGVASGAVNP